MNISPTAPTRPAFRYHGAKWNLAKWIIPQLPPHELYCEPFAGSAGVLLQKPRSYLEVLNDLDGEVVAFFRALRDFPDELINAIELTPFSKAEWELSFFPAEDVIEKARRFYLRSYTSIAGPTATWKTGWRRQKVLSRGSDGRKKMTPAAITFMNTSHLHQVAQRLRGVTIERDDAIEVMARYDSPKTLFYVDPPYVFETRGRWKDHAYAHEMDDEAHCKLAAALHQMEGAVILSGYNCPLYKELFGDWKRLDRKARVNGPGHAVESLWLSPAVAHLTSYRDLPIFR